MSEPRPLRMSWVALLYLASGLPYGIVHQLVPAWLKVQGAGLEAIGVASLLGLPWTLKALWAPAVDRLGRAATWIAGALLVMALSLAAVPYLPLGPAVAIALLVVATASATQDVAIDGATTAAVPRELQGRANGVRVAAYRAAMLLAGGGAVALAEWVDWSWIFLGLAALCLALIAVVPGFPESPRRAETAQDWVGALLGWVLRADTVPLFLFVLTYKLGDAAMSPMITPFWLDSGLSLGQLGLISTSLGMGLTVLGALLGGELITRWGLYPSLWALGGFQAFTNLIYAAAAFAPSFGAIVTASVAESLGQGLGTSVFLAAIMRATAGEQTATRFAVLTAAAGLTRTLSGAVSGYLAQGLGYGMYFTLTFALALPAFALLPLLRRRLA